MTGSYIINNSGNMNFGTNIGGMGNTYPRPEPRPGTPDRLPTPPEDRRRADIGVLTVLREEMTAVVEVLERLPGYHTEQLYGGAQAHEAQLPVEHGVLRIAALQALEPGTHSAALAYRELRRAFQPEIVLLVGIAGGIGTGIEIGDVVISDEVIYYEPRRVTATGDRHRGRTHAMAPVLRHRVSEFLRRNGPTIHPAPDVEVRIHRGPIGSGNAVVADRGASIPAWLREVHEKTLAVETEAGGVAQAFYEEIDIDSELRGWLTIRGISDLADRHKGHAYHGLAARHAALVLERLLPYLWLVRSPQ